MKSVSGSRGKAHPKLKRTLKRGIEIRKVEDRDIRFAYAAYKMGCFKGIEKRDLSAPEFLSEIVNHTLGAIEIWTSVVDKPICMAVVQRALNLNELHVEWFPWATPRQKLESVVKFLHEYDSNLVTSAKDEFVDFFNRVTRYGVLRKVGRIENMFEPGVDGTIYQRKQL